MLVSYEACDLLPSLFVRVLVIERADARLWAILAERFPSITSITCLSDDAILHNPRNGDTLLFITLVRAFQKLAFLKLSRIRLEARAGEEVLKWLRMRKEARVPVNQLVLERCHPCSTWLAAVRGIIEHVEVVESREPYCSSCRTRQA